ncbi:MAG: nucleotidyltransferase [Verrucomicrobiia bacterium]
MAIPESQLETWSHQGSITQSKETYATIKAALESPKALYADKSFEVCLQGSYGNDSNIYAESDVDTVIRLDSIMRGDVSKLPLDQQAAYHLANGTASYTFGEFKQGVVTRLSTAFGSDSVPGNKAIKIKASGSRRNADVVPCYLYRRYTRFISNSNCDYVEGIIFPTSLSGEIINFPKIHSQNLTKKHQATNHWFKPMVRIFKNMRCKLVDDGAIGKGIAPSYFIEGLLYNVPIEKFTGNCQEIVLNILRWLYQTNDRTNFVCANEQYYLLRDDSMVCWPIANGDQFIKAVIALWNNW